MNNERNFLYALSLQKIKHKKFLSVNAYIPQKLNFVYTVYRNVTDYMGYDLFYIFYHINKIDQFVSLSENFEYQTIEKQTAVIFFSFIF